MMRWIVVVLAACTVGPTYHRPPAPLPPNDQWKIASPGDAIPRGRWWSMFRDPELDALEARLNVNNQNILQAVENYRAATAQVRAGRALYFPTLSVSPSATISRGRSGGAPSDTTSVQRGRVTLYSLPGEVSWAPDLFGRVRNTVRQRRYAAEASAADLESVRLLQQSTLAQTYFELRGQDSLIQLLDATVAANEEVVNLTGASNRLGLTNDADVLQARLTLQTSRVQATNAHLARAQFEHAIATLIGMPASSFTMPARALAATPPRIPASTPSQLLERRPDIAAAERMMASANAAIGVAYVAYFPTLNLTGSGGFSASSLAKLLTWPSRFWSLGSSLAETLFDAGLRGAQIDQAIATYNAAVATYRQTVLTAFQQVEDELAAQRILADAVAQQVLAVQLAEKSFEIEKARYSTGLDPYVTLMTQQTALLAARQSLLTLRIQQMTSSVRLIQYLGGGWRAH